MLLLQHNRCKEENQERLNRVTSLEELVKFKVVTLASKLDEQSKQ